MTTPSPITDQAAGDLLAFESALSELVNKIDTGLDSGDLLIDARRASDALDAILTKGDLVANAYDYFRELPGHYENSREFRIGWNACLDAIGAARVARSAAPTTGSAPAPNMMARCENRAFVTVGFKSPEECTAFIRAVNHAVPASPAASVLTDDQIETAATHIWDHFGPDHEMTWAEASNKDTYRSAARAALAASMGGDRT